MGNDNIIQFVSFITDLDRDSFIAKWEIYAAECVTVSSPALFQLSAKNGRYRYISKLECKEPDFRFAFRKGKKSEHFPDQKAKIVQAGGYIPVQMQYNHSKESTDLTLILFVEKNHWNIDAYKKLPGYRYLNIYQAYYESCAYEYVLEFCISESNADHLLQQIKTKPGIEADLYHCLTVPV